MGSLRWTKEKAGVLPLYYTRTGKQYHKTVGASRFSLGRIIRLFWFTLLDRRTPISAKILLVAGLLYGIVPIDLIPDVLLGLGQIDDAGVLLAAFLLFLAMTKGIRKDLEKTM